MSGEKRIRAQLSVRGVAAKVPHSPAINHTEGFRVF
jgi:hypothetical protein